MEMELQEQKQQMVVWGEQTVRESHERECACVKVVAVLRETCGRCNSGVCRFGRMSGAGCLDVFRY